MKNNLGISTVVAIVATLGLTSQAWAACNVNDTQTGAANTFELSGQGNFTCDDLNMVPLVVTFTPGSGKSVNWVSSIKRAAAVVVTPSNGARCIYLYPNQAFSGNNLSPGSNKAVSSALACTDNAPGIVEATATVSADTGSVTEGDAITLVTTGKVTITDPDPADALAIPTTTPIPGIYGFFNIFSTGDWVYEVSNTVVEGLGLASGDSMDETPFTITSINGATNQVIVTIYGSDAAMAEVLPTTTAGVEACTGTINNAGNLIFEGGVVMAESLDGQEVAVCNAEAGGLQSYCEDSCVNFRDVGETLNCTGSVDPVTGEYDLTECQPCDTANDVILAGGNAPVHPITGDAMEFCWEKTGSVYEGTADLVLDPPPDLVDTTTGNVIPRSANTMLKHAAVRQSGNTITWYNKCYKTKTEVNGRTYTVTTCR